MSHLATFGTWPRRPDRGLLEACGLSPSAAYDVFRQTIFQAVEQPGPCDLAERLDGTTSWPSEQTLVQLRPGRAHRGGAWILDPLVPGEHTIAADIGPNLVVVYQPGSTADLALLWNIRAAHGVPSGLPLGVPVNATYQQRSTRFGTVGSRPAGGSS
jgi:hypothetical protein